MFKTKSKFNYDYFNSIPIYYKILGLVCCVAVTFSAVYLIVHAGNIDSPAIPATDTGRMYTLEQIYQKLYNGTVATKQSGGFTEPGSAPGSTMHTLDNIYGDFTTDATSCASTTAADVRSGKTFFATSGTTRGTSWGPTTGTMYPGSLLVTGQTTVYTTNDDGTYQKGLAKSYSDDTVNSIKVGVKDANTDLEWQKCSAGLSGSTCATGAAAAKTWANAILYCEYLRLCGDGTYQGSEAGEGDCTGHTSVVSTDWRLPNINELLSLVNYKNYNPVIDTTAFPATQSDDYWSSTTYASPTTYAWLMYFYVGYGDYYAKTSSFYVRCVRQY